MRILFIVDYYYPSVGGAETLYRKLAEGLALHHEVQVLTQQHGHGLPDEEVLNGVRIYRVNTYQRASFPYQGFPLAKRLVKNVDVIQAATYSSGILAWRLKKFTDKKIFLIVHEYLTRRWLSLGVGGLIAYLYEKYLFLHSFDHYIAVSKSTYNQLKASGIASTRLSTIYNGIDYEHFAPQPINYTLRDSLGIKPDDTLFLFSGRLGITKGVMLLLQAWQAWERPAGARLLLIVGQADGIERERIETFIRLHNLLNSVHIIDSVSYPQLPNYIAAANVVVVPSLTEGFGFFAAEVSAMQVPLVVTPIDALPEVVSGKVIFTHDLSPHAIVEALQQAYRGNFTNVSSKKFLWLDTVAQYEKLYQSVSI